MTFEVTSPIRHDLKRYEVGEVIELDQSEADLMPWALKPTKKKPDTKLEVLKGAQAGVARAKETAAAGPGASALRREAAAAQSEVDKAQDKLNQK